MDVLERLNRRFGSWYEGLFGGGGAERELRPRDILRRIVTAMEDNRREGLDGAVYVPNSYILQIAPESDEERDYLRAFLDAEELSGAVRRTLDQHNYKIKGGLDFRIEEVPPGDPSLADHRVHVRCRFDPSIPERGGSAGGSGAAVQAVPTMQAVRLPESEFPRPAPAGPNRAAPSFGAPVRPSDASDDDIEELGTVAAPFAGAAAGPVLASLLIRAGDGRVLDVYPMTPQGVAVGRSRRSGNEIVLRDDPLVSKRHARIVHDGRTFVAYDQGSTNGTFVNGAPLEPGVGRPLEFGDEVQVGETVLALRPAGQDPRAASAPAAPGWRLVAGDGESIPLSGTMGVGAAGSNQLVVHSPGVAGNHARITVQGSDVLVEDLNSPGGTYINGERIPPLFPIALFEGHQVTFGQAMFRLIRGVGTAGAR